MDKWNSIEEALDFAIEREQEAADFYFALVEKLPQKHMKDVLERFAKEELGHKARLTAIKNKKMVHAEPTQVQDLKIGEYLTEMDADKITDYQSALIVAMKREKAAFKLYSDLAAMADTEGIRNVMLRLAEDEARHKLRFEVEYDDYILIEN